MGLFLPIPHGEVITSVSVCDIEDIIAVATATGVVSFFDTNGERRGTTDGVGSKGAHVSKLSWKPNSGNFLVCGRSDGEIKCLSVVESSTDKRWFRAENKVYTNKKVHQSEINFIVWKSSTYSSQTKVTFEDCIRKEKNK